MRLSSRERRKQSYDLFIPKKIGVFGLHPHAGVTYVSVLLAEYLSHIAGLKTAVYENSQRNDLISLREFSKSAGREEGEEFTLHDIVFDVSKYHSEQKNYDCCIFDLGCNYGRAREELLTCDCCLLLFKMTPWYLKDSMFDVINQEEIRIKQGVHLIGNMISEGEKKTVKQLGLKVSYLSFEPELFCPSQEAIHLFHQLIF